MVITNRIKLIIVSFTWLLLIHLTLALSPHSVQVCKDNGFCRLSIGESVGPNGLTFVYVVSTLVFVSLVVLELIRVSKVIRSNVAEKSENL